MYILYRLKTIFLCTKFISSPSARGLGEPLSTANSLLVRLVASAVRRVGEGGSAGGGGGGTFCVKLITP